MSGQLSCSAVNCVNNVNRLCTASTIHVLGSGAHTSNQTMCNTFAPRELKNALKNLANMNVSGEIRQIFAGNTIEMSPGIKCEAINCIYNEGRLCKARNIQINGLNADDSEGTICETFRNE